MFGSYIDCAAIELEYVVLAKINVIMSCDKHFKLINFKNIGVVYLCLFIL